MTSGPEQIRRDRPWLVTSGAHVTLPEAGQIGGTSLNRQGLVRMTSRWVVRVIAT
jgi:hypothetical protein